MSITKEEIQGYETVCQQTRQRLLDKDMKGPWDDEPNRKEFRYKGFVCLAIRNAHTLAWCGYVGVPPSHPFHGKLYDDLDVHVHGGLTYADDCKNVVCHIPGPGEEDKLYWIGFDCSHYEDFIPGFMALPVELPYMQMNIYRDLAFVERQIKSLAQQFRKAAA